MKAMIAAWRHLGQALFVSSLLLVSPNMQAASPDPLPEVAALVAKLNAKYAAPTVEQFLEAAPASWRENHTFIYASHSLQGASRTHPRAIAFTGDGRLILTFNGEPGQAGFHRIEMAMVRPDTKTLEFRDISFCEKSGTETCQAVLSAANPSKCQGCHGQSPNYIWQAYHSWDGAYGSQNDILADGEAQEAEDFAVFKQAWPQHPRYRYLPIPANSLPSYPYRAEREVGLHTDQRANNHLTMVIMRQHARVLAEKILLATADKPAELTQLIQQLAACPNYPTEAAYSAIRATAARLGLSLDDHWHLGLGFGAAGESETLSYSDGLLRLPGTILSFLLPRIPAYAPLLRDKGFFYREIYDVYDNGETPSERDLAIFTAIDQLGASYPELGYFNFLAEIVPQAKRVDKAAICAIRLSEGLASR